MIIGSLAGVNHRTVVKTELPYAIKGKKSKATWITTRFAKQSLDSSCHASFSKVLTNLHVKVFAQDKVPLLGGILGSKASIVIFSG